MSIPIPQTLVIWVSPSHITLAIWVRVNLVPRVSPTLLYGERQPGYLVGLGLGLQKMPISLGLWKWGYPYHCDTAPPLF